MTQESLLVVEGGKKDRIVHFGVLGCVFMSPRPVRAICNYRIRGTRGDKRFAMDVSKVTCKRCKRY